MTAILEIKRYLILVGISLGLCALSLPHLNSEVQSKSRISDEPLYLPSLDGVNFLAFGYNAMVSNLFWINTVSYFGKHYATDHNYRWLNHMCNLVFRLNPRVYEPYFFCATMQAWELEEIETAISTLTKAIDAHPHDWFFFYQRGFYKMHFLNDTPGAKDDFIKASKTPNAHPIAARLAAKTISELEDPTVAITFISEQIRSSTDPNQRAMLEDRLRELISERNFLVLESGVRRHIELHNALPRSLTDLVNTGIINRIPVDPQGGEYYLNLDGEVLSSSGRKRLKHYGKRSHE